MMCQALSTADQAFLERALTLGRRGWGRVHPNPMVGCVLVLDGVVVGEGWHQAYGDSHAEANALTQAGEKARGATAFVSLEPCHHIGHTPPCSNALREAGIARLVYGAPDPGKVSGGGAAALAAEGMEIVGPVLDPQAARRENPAFFHNHEHQSTFVAIKLAQTLDGRIAEARGKRTLITGPEALLETHRLRGGFDGIFVGSETILVDDPLLTVREGVPFQKAPARVILDSFCRISVRSRVFQDVPDCPLVIFTGEGVVENRIEECEAAGAHVHPVPRGVGGLDLNEVLRICWETGLRSLFCEGGGRVAASLLRGGFARRLYLFVAPFVLGEKGVPAFPGIESPGLWDPWTPARPPEVFGRDVLLTYDRRD
jgi:diaminohydroxyphosphoribosylaminopyrimidine deaminase/5-amino-6-(5-phosphoribosylamino)uracil reductase